MSRWGSGGGGGGGGDGRWEQHGQSLEHEAGEEREGACVLGSEMVERAGCRKVRAAGSRTLQYVFLDAVLSPKSRMQRKNRMKTLFPREGASKLKGVPQGWLGGG